MRCRKELEKIKGYQPGKPIEEVKRMLKLDEVYKLASNEIPFSPSYIRKVVTSEIKNINRYPESGSFYLRKALASKLKVKEDQLIFGNGSDELITLSLRAFVNPGEEVVVAYPTFLIYEMQAKIQGARIRRVPLKKCCYCLDDMAKKVNKKTKIIFIANPDNPTGTYLTHSEVKDFLKKIPDTVLVFFDEAYFEFAPDDRARTLDLLKLRKNILITRTFSKAYGLAGLRIGYGVANIQIALILNKIREPFNINRFAQVAAVEALKNKLFLQKVIKHADKEKKYLYCQLKKLGIYFTKSATNFILVDFKTETSFLCDYLLKNGIIIRELKGWGLTNFFRVTVGYHNENKKFIKHLERYLAQKGGSQ